MDIYEIGLIITMSIFSTNVVTPNAHWGKRVHEISLL